MLRLVAALPPPVQMTLLFHLHQSIYTRHCLPSCTHTRVPEQVRCHLMEYLGRHLWRCSWRCSKWGSRRCSGRCFGGSEEKFTKGKNFAAVFRLEYQPPQTISETWLVVRCDGIMEVCRKFIGWHKLSKQYGVYTVYCVAPNCPAAGGELMGAGGTLSGTNPQLNFLHEL